MPTVACLQTLQRELADSIIRCAPLDDLRILLACGAKADAPVTREGLRPIHYAAHQRHLEALNLLLVRGSDPDAQDEVGYTALHLCAERGYEELVRLLLRHGAKVCFTDQQEGTLLGNPPRAALADEPLRLAIKGGHYAVAELLLRNGADPNARYFLGAEINLIGPLNVPFLELLLRYGADPDSRDRAGLTPLMRAARHPRGLAAAKVLLRYGADANGMTGERHDKRTVLHYAVLSGNIETVRLLLEKGARVRFPEDYLKPSPLDFAILRGNPDMVRLLVERGADVNLGSPIIGCPLHIALSEKVDHKREIIEFLLEKGADPNCVSVGGGHLIRPPLGEYLHSCEDPQEGVVRLLLGRGARLLLLTQSQNPLGILRCVGRRLHPALTEVLTETAEAYNAPAIERSILLSDAQRGALLRCALTPLRLKHLMRLWVRRELTGGGDASALFQKVRRLPIPTTLQMYLLYQM